VKTLGRIIWLSLTLALPTTAAELKPKAEEVLAKAKTKATAEHKAIFIVFDASW
jgi:hypothetical protein